MSTPATLRVIAASPSARLPFYAGARAILGRFVGMNRAGEPSAEVVVVTPYITRALSRGDLLLAPLAEPTPPAPAAEDAPAEPAPPADLPPVA
jgi:hypothetical protein